MIDGLWSADEDVLTEFCNRYASVHVRTVTEVRRFQRANGYYQVRTHFLASCQA